MNTLTKDVQETAQSSKQNILETAMLGHSSTTVKYIQPAIQILLTQNTSYSLLLTLLKLKFTPKLALFSFCENKASTMIGHLPKFQLPNPMNSLSKVT